jgi:pSer/pThr/pTyr-binding forkhead associated (FHA) protein
MYGFRVNGGQAYPLDAVHYFGRNPRQPRIPLPDPSRLVPVVSSTKSVSATHLEIKQVGDSIVATDLKSTNGTSVNLPHKHWQRLRQGESIVVVPGTLIDIGDGNVIEILPPWRGE